MKNILKWLVIFVGAFAVIRIVVGIIISVAKSFFGFLQNINIGMVVITLIIMAVLFIWYQTRSLQQHKTPVNTYEAPKSAQVKRTPTKTEQASKKVRQPQPQKKVPATDFVQFAKEVTPTQLKKHVEETYSRLKQAYKYEAGFGESGALEFVGSIVLGNFDHSLKRDIEKGYREVFTKNWSPLQFSDYMDEVVHASKVPYEKWSEVYRYLQQHHDWIQRYPCAKPALINSSKVQESVYQAAIDLQQVALATEKGVQYLYEQNVEQGIKQLKQVVQQLKQHIVQNTDMNFTNINTVAQWQQVLLELSNATTYYGLALYTYYREIEAPIKAYDTPSNALAVALVSLPRHGESWPAVENVLNIYAKCLAMQGIAMYKENVEKMKIMTWDVEGAVRETKQLIQSGYLD